MRNKSLQSKIVDDHIIRASLFFIKKKKTVSSPYILLAKCSAIALFLQIKKNIKNFELNDLI